MLYFVYLVRSNTLAYYLIGLIVSGPLMKVALLFPVAASDFTSFARKLYYWLMDDSVLAAHRLTVSILNSFCFFVNYSATIPK